MLGNFIAKYQTSGYWRNRLLPFVQLVRWSHQTLQTVRSTVEEGSLPLLHSSPTRLC
jgi:hypothetical protein